MSAATLIPDGKFAESYPEIRRVEVPTSPMVSEEYFNQERELLFRRAWLYAGRVEDLDRPGGYLVRALHPCKVSVLLVRGDDGKIRGFYNVCRHRCNKLVVERGGGTARAFSCSYHGWTYDLEGRLIGLPDQEQFESYKREELTLVPIATEIWKGFIFVNLEPHPRESLREYLGEIYDGPVSHYEFFDKPTDSFTWEMELRANWKVGIDLFSESYHVATVHKNSVRRLYTNQSNKYGHFKVMNFMGRHRLMTIGYDGSPKQGPVAQIVTKHASAISRFRNANTMSGDIPGVNPAGIARWAADVYYLFPNFEILMFGPALWHFHYFQPLAPDRMLWEHRLFFPKADRATARFSTRFAQEFSRSMQQIVASEDISIAESNQEGLEMGAPELQALQEDQEMSIRHLRKAVDEYMSFSR